MTDESLMPFGKHKGKPLADVPDDYFLYLWRQPDFAANRRSELYQYIKENMDAIQAHIKRKK